MSEILTPIKTFNNHPLVDTFSREQIESINKNMLTGEDLSGAVNSALEQAKQTGMFDGEDGVGIETVIVPRSPNENGELDISFKLTDGQIHTFTVKYGKDGKDGNGIASAALNADYTLTLTFTDGTKYTTPSIRGAAGAAGSDGKDGTSVTVKSVSESSADGGSNVVTFSDGKTVTIKNGSKGSDGAAGKDGKDGSDATVTAANIKSALGYTPANATTVSQLSEAIGDNQEQLSQLSAELDAIGTQEDIVQQVIAALGTPVFGTIDENNVITLTGSLADGTYTVKYEDAEGNTTEVGDIVVSSGPAYTNLADPTSSDWLTDKRLNSSGVVTDTTPALTTNYMPVKLGDTVRVRYMNIRHQGSDTGNATSHFYDADKNRVAALTPAELNNNQLVSDADGLGVTFVVSTDLASLTVVSGMSANNIYYMRLVGKLYDGYTADDIIVTVNEEITE